MTRKPTYEELEKQVEELKKESGRCKQAQEMLEESEKRYRILFENSTDFVFTTDLKGRFTDVNKAATLLTGYSKDELIGMYFKDYTPAYSHEEIHETFSRVFRTGEPLQDFPIEVKVKDGTKKYFEISFSPLMEGTSIIGFQGSSRDITARKLTEEELEKYSDELGRSNEALWTEIIKRRHTEEALRKSEETYRLLADNVSDNIWVIDLNTLKFSYVSPSVIGVTGFSPEEATGFQMQDVLTPSSLELATKVLSQELEKAGRKPDPSRSRVLELEQCHKEGGTVWTEVSMRFIFDSEGLPTSILGVTRNISKRKRLQDQLQQAKRMEAVGLLAGGVAHDLNNILSGIVSNPELLLLNLPEDSQFKGPLEDIRESGLRAANVVDDLLTVARGIACNKEIANFNEIIKEYLLSAEYGALKRRHPSVEVKTRFSPDLLNTNCSPIHLRKTLMNLIINASEAISDVGTIVISTGSRYVDQPLNGYDDVLQGEYVVLMVSDNGPGITPEDLDRIFEPFYTKKVMGRSGTGLGLSVVWNTVQDHNGYINVKSDESGTVFELYFPATRDKPRVEPEPIPLEDYLGNGERILVVDDEESQQKIACGLLASLGYSAEAVSSGEEAVEYMKEHSVDLMVLDMIMDPGINGRETYERILAIHPNQKAVIASGFSKTWEVEETQRLGAGQYIKKPYTLEKLGLAVKGELEK